MIHRDDLKYLFQPVFYGRLYGMMNEIFFEQPYRWLYENIKPDTIVIDIGSYIGDTPTYFALHPNTKKVLAYEPNPGAFKLLKKNTKPNHKIEGANVGVSGISAQPHSKITTTKFNGIAGKQADQNWAEAVPVIAINEILKGKNKVVIKCDCEGEEYKIFNTNTNLSNVYAIMIEYHRGLKEIPAILKAKGFRVEHQMYKGSSYQGYIMAIRER